MADKTGIEWADASWNPVVGCSIVSPGCTNCYAMKQAYRIEKMSAGAGRKSHYAGTTQQSKAGAVWTGKVNLAPDHIINQPLRWKRPRRIFVNSMSDLFHPDVPFQWTEQIWDVMFDCPQHTFQILTKRPEVMLAFSKYMTERCRRMDYPNIWLGVSVEDQARADERIPSLLSTPAAVRFLSCEPLLGPVDLSAWMPAGKASWECGYCRHFFSGKHQQICPNCNKSGGLSGSHVANKRCPGTFTGWTDRQPIDLVIVGGESGPGARPMNPDWARSLRDQCQAADVPYFFKQWGEYVGGEVISDGEMVWFTPESRNEAAGVILKRDSKRDAKRFDDSFWKNLREFGDQDVIDSGGPEPASYKVGKKAAGRLLGDRTWDEMPGTDIDVGTKQEAS